MNKIFSNKLSALGLALILLGSVGLFSVFLGPREPVPSQIDRIETKLDQLLERP